MFNPIHALLCAEQFREQISGEAYQLHVERKAALLIFDNINGPCPIVETNLFFGDSMLVDLREVVSRQLFLFGFVERELSLFMWRTLKPGMVVFDVGAHLGYFSLLAANRVGSKGAVIGFEPTPNTYIRLHQNTCNYQNIKVIQKAAWNHCDGLLINDFGPKLAAYNSVAGIRMMPGEVSPRANLLWAETTTIDRFVQETATRPDFIKIDAESSEFEVLVGTEVVLRDVRPIVSIEVGDYAHLMAQGVASTRATLTKIMQYGYSVFDPTIAGLTFHALHEEDNYEYSNLICIPTERVHEFNLESYNETGT
jgi:FkbM family methyltransferase